MAFTERDKKRLRKLNAKRKAGELDDEEREELNELIHDKLEAEEEADTAADKKKKGKDTDDTDDDDTDDDDTDDDDTDDDDTDEVEPEKKKFAQRFFD